VQFGFGPIGAGLFVREALRSGAFDHIVAVDVACDLVQAVRAAGGRYFLNVAERDRRRAEDLGPVEMRCLNDPADAARLAEDLDAMGEAATALPSVDFYERGTPSVADLLAVAADRRARDSTLPAAIVYCGENDHQAAERLAELVARRRRTRDEGRLAFLNTVIGKMSRAVADPDELRLMALAPIAPGLNRAFLVEAFNAILVARPPAFTPPRRITVFREKSDLLPFKEAKLYGHNAVHALIGFLGAERRWATVAEAVADPSIASAARSALMEESGAALRRKYGGGDVLFTESGWRAYAEDLWARMANPYLGDPVARIIRDPWRKLGWTDRLVGTMRLALSQEIVPRHYARGVAAALRQLGIREAEAAESALKEHWKDHRPDPDECERVLSLLRREWRGSE